MSKALTLEFIQNKLKEKYNGLITIVPESFVQGQKYAIFFDHEFGQWRTRIQRVLAGSVCKKRSRRLNLSKVQEKLDFLYGVSNVVLVPESYVKVGAKAKFKDSLFGEYEAFVSNVLSGHRGTRVKYVHPETKEPLINFWQRFGGNKITMQKVVSKYGVEAAITYLKENLDSNGQYKSYISSLELEFQTLFLNTKINIERWNKCVPELDNLCRPDFKLTYCNKILYIDVHGLFIHTSLYKDKKYHFNRRILFAENNIRYMQFYEDEIRFNGDIVKSIVHNYFGLSNNKYFARKLILKEVFNTEADKFFTANHLMGFHSTSKSVGLYSGDELICCLSYRGSFTKGKIEISRFATKLNTSCVGGFGKLVNYLKQFNKPIISYCDLRYGTGKSYVALGFKELGTTLGWEWTNGVNRFNRTKCKAGNGKTEKENASELGWYRIYDAGQRKYELIINEQKNIQ